MNKFLPILLLVFVVIISGCVNPVTPSDNKCNWKPGPCEMIISEGYSLNLETNKCEFSSQSSGCSSPPFKTVEECQSVCGGSVQTEKVCDLEPCPNPSSQCDWRTKSTDMAVCPAIFYPENICLQFLDCVIEEDSCNTVKSPQYQECIDCFKGGNQQECTSRYGAKQAEVKQVIQPKNMLEIRSEGFFRTCDYEPKLFLKEDGSWVEKIIELPWESTALVDGVDIAPMCDVVVCQNMLNEPVEIKLKSYESMGGKLYNNQTVQAYKTVPIVGNVKVEVDYYQTQQDCEDRKNKKMLSHELEVFD